MERMQICSKKRKHRGREYGGEYSGVDAEIVRNESIHMIGTHNGRPVDITFRVGDLAEYDSYNLHYLGTIEKITDKCVTIKPRYNNRVRRLSLYEFMWRNRNFDLEAITRRNAETSMYI